MVQQQILSMSVSANKYMSLLLTCLLGGWGPAVADEQDAKTAQGPESTSDTTADLAVKTASDTQDLQATVQKLQKMLEKQQETLDAQQQELAKQSALIKNLQDAQGVASAPTPTAPPKSDVSENIAATSQDDDTIPSVVTQEPAEPGSQDQTIAAADSKQQIEWEEAESEGGWLTDPSDTTYDPDFKGAWHLPGTSAAMRIGGYVNLSIVNSFDPMLITDRFIVGSIPPDDEMVSGAEKGMNVSATQTRINYEVREQTKHGLVRAFVEADFRGTGDTFRLRHAYGQYKWLLAGKTWSTFMDVESRPEEVDIEGINGQILVRQPQLRFFPRIGQSLAFKFALENPETDVVNGTGVNGAADFVLSVDRLPLGGLGTWNSRVGFILRNLKAEIPGDLTTPEGDVVTGTSSTTGWGVTTSGKHPMSWWSEDDFFVWQLTYGKGVGRYINDLATVGGGDAVINPIGQIAALPVFSGYASYRHLWAKDKWFFKSWTGRMRSNFTVSWVNIDNYIYQDDKDYNSTLRVSANLIYMPADNIVMGVELLWGERKNKDESKGDAMQLQLGIRYDF